MIKRYRGTFEAEYNGPIITAEFVAASDFDEAVRLLWKHSGTDEGCNCDDCGPVNEFIARANSEPQRVIEVPGATPRMTMEQWWAFEEAAKNPELHKGVPGLDAVPQKGTDSQSDAEANAVLQPRTK